LNIIIGDDDDCDDNNDAYDDGLHRWLRLSHNQFHITGPTTEKARQP